MIAIVVESGRRNCGPEKVGECGVESGRSGGGTHVPHSQQ